MHFLQIKTLGIIILILSVLQGIIIVFSKGSIKFQKPEGGFIPWLYNITNLAILIVITPIVSVLLLKKIITPFEITSINLPNNLFSHFLEIMGFVFYFTGNLILYITRIVLWNNFRLGAVAPESKDQLILSGSFKLMRHPMYFAVIVMTLGLSLVLHSWLFFLFFLILFYTIIKMIPVEENQLINAYGKNYISYQKKVKKLFPFIY